MNKKMLLVVLMPFAMNAHLKEFYNDVKAQSERLHACASQPFGKGHENLNKITTAVNHDLVQRAVKKYVSALDAKYVGKTLVDAKGVKLASGDVLCFAAAVAVSCKNDKLNESKNSDARNACEHAATRLVVVGLDKAYDAVEPKIASLVGVESLSLDAAVNEVLPEAVAKTINYVRTTLVRAAVYEVVRNAVARCLQGFFSAQ